MSTCVPFAVVAGIGACLLMACATSQSTQTTTEKKQIVASAPVLVREETQGPDGRSSGFVVYEYDKVGVLFRENKYNDKKIVFKQSDYTANGSVVSKTEKDLDGKILSITRYTYANGKLSREDFHSGNGDLFGTTLYVYSELGLPIQMQFLDKNGMVVETRILQFEIFSRTETVTIP